MTKAKINQTPTYEDGFVFCAVVDFDGSPIVSLANCVGDCKCFSVCDNHYSTEEVVESYEELLMPEYWGMEKAKAEKLKENFKEWLLKD